MRMSRFAVCLFSHHKVDNNSQFRVQYALSPEQALAKALGIGSTQGIEPAGEMDGINFYQYQGNEHIVHQLPNGL